MAPIGTQREARVLFTRLMAEWQFWATHQGGLGPNEELAQGEGYVALTDGRDGDHDGPHKAGGAHYLGTGSDWLLYRNGAYITKGDDPTWIRLGRKWKSLHPLCRWGGDFRGGDANHLSIEWGGRS